jgi:2'-5' RNA ligase
MTPSPPLILTVWMDDGSFGRLDALRRAHFPPERNVIPAHLTLFHHLPGAELDGIADTVRAHCTACPAFEIAATALRSLGRGVAITMESPPLLALRSALARDFAPWLTLQDRQGFRPHATVQNKVTPDAARALLDTLSAGFEPFAVKAEGLALWRYLGGPWKRVARFPFAPP